MNIRTRTLADGKKRYDVFYEEGGRKRSRTFVRKGDADAFDLDKRRRRALGPLASQVIRSKQTLAEFVEEVYWPHHAIPNLAADTRRRYLELWGRYALPQLGAYELLTITPEVLQEFDRNLVGRDRDNPRVSAEERRKLLYLIQGILHLAEVHVATTGVTDNAAKRVPKPRVKPGEMPRPLPPETVERIRMFMLTRAWASEKRGTGRSPYELEWWRRRNALIVSMLAYAGVRPCEDRNATWNHVHGRGDVLHVDATKTSRARDVDLVAPLARELAEWRMFCGRPDADALIIPRTVPGRWTKSDWDNWRGRDYRPAAMAVLGENAPGPHPYRPYRLRGSFVSLLLWAGEDSSYVAEQAGHGLKTLDRYYRGVMRELRGQTRVPAADAITAARERVFSEPEDIRKMMGSDGAGR